MSIHDWFKRVQEHATDSRWLAQYEDSLRPVITTGLQTPRDFHTAVDLLMLVIPQYVTVLFHTKRWIPLLLEALLQAQDLRDSEMQVRILTQLGEAYITTDKNSPAYESFKIALERASEGQMTEMMLAAYVGLIRMQSISMGDDYNPDLLAFALALSREIDDLPLKAAVHQALALAYIHAHETVAAIEHAQIAYVYWHHLENDLERAKSLYLLSAAYRFAGSLERAEEILQWMAIHFENTEYNRQYTLLAYEAGAVYLGRKEYEAAAQWLTISLREATTINAPYLIAASYHALGIAQTGMARYDDAIISLQQAIARWKVLKNFYELASAHQAMGNLENKRKQPERALEWLQLALELCLKTPPSAQRTWLEGHIRDTIDEIPW